MDFFHMTIWFKIVAPSCVSHEDDGNCIVARSQIRACTQENKPDASVERAPWFARVRPGLCPYVCGCQRVLSVSRLCSEGRNCPSAISGNTRKLFQVIAVCVSVSHFLKHTPPYIQRLSLKCPFSFVLFFYHLTNPCRKKKIQCKIGLVLRRLEWVAITAFFENTM